MIHIESDNGKVFVKAEGSVENIVNDVINSMDNLVEELTKDDGDEAGTIVAAFIVTALAKMWGQSKEGFFEVAHDAAKVLHVGKGKPPEDSEESAEEYAGVKA